MVEIYSDVKVLSGTVDAAQTFESTDANVWIEFRDNSTDPAFSPKVGVVGNSLFIKSGSDDVTDLTVDPGGNVIINGTAITKPLTNYAQLEVVSRGEGASLRVTNTSGKQGHFQIGSGAEYDNIYIGTDLINNTTGEVHITAGGDSRIAVLPDGNVGIGTPTPNALYKCHISSSSHQVLRLSGNTGNTSTNNCMITFEGGKDGQTWHIGTDVELGNGSEDLHFYESGAGVRVTFAEGGNVGIGDTSPDYKLDVTGSVRATTDIRSHNHVRTLSVGGGGRWYYMRGDATTDKMHLGLRTANDTVDSDALTITSGGLVGIGTTNPSTTLHVNGLVQTDRALGSTPSSNLDATVLASFRNVNKPTDPRVLDICTDENNYAVLRSVATSLRFAPSGTTQFYMTNTGLGIGVIPAYKLHVSGMAYVAGDTYVTGTLVANTLSSSSLIVSGLTTGYLPYSNGGKLAASGIFTNNGNFGLGTTSLGTNRLTVNGNTSVVGSMTSTSVSTSSLSVTSGLNSGYFTYISGTTFTNGTVLYTNGTNVGVGTTSLGAKLDVNGTVRLVQGLSMSGGGDANEGAQIDMYGGTSYPEAVNIDRYQDQLRFLTNNSSDFNTVMQNLGAGKWNVNIAGNLLADTYQEVLDVQSVSGTFNITEKTGTLKKFTVTGNTTFTHTTSPGHSITLILIGGDAFTINWPAGAGGIWWTDGSAPTLTGQDVIVLTNVHTVSGTAKVVGTYVGSIL